MPQLTIRSEMLHATAGQLVGIDQNRKIITKVNSSVQTELFTVDAADLETVVTINSTAISVNPTPVSRTKALLVTDLITAINASSAINTAVIAKADPANTDKFFVESLTPGTVFTFAATTNTTVLALSPIDNETSVKFGFFVTQDQSVGNNNKAHTPNAAGDITGERLALGFAIKSPQEQTLGGNVGYASNSAMSILTQGEIWVDMEDVANVVAGGQVFIRHVATAPEERGKARTDADTSDADAVPNCKFTGEVQAADNIAVVSINNL